MKSVLLFLALAFSFSSAHAMKLWDVVLSEDVTEPPVYQSFPCSAYIDVIGCGNLLVLEKGCAKTLKINGDSLSCVSLKGDVVEFGKVDRKSKFADDTQPGTFGYRVNYSPRVHLNEYKTRNGNFEYELTVN